MASTFFKGRIDRNIADPEVSPESGELDYPLGDSTVLETIANVIAHGTRMVGLRDDKDVFFQLPDGTWVHLNFDAGSITLELGEPAA